MRLPLLVILITALTFPLCSSADTRTTRKKLKRITEVTDTLSHIDNDSCAVCDSLLFSNYDKPLRSTKETFFIDNNSCRTLRAVTVTLTYLHLDGTMIHSREITLACDIPPGERRQLSRTSWDIQLAYYYAGTRIIPRTKKAIPFKVHAVITHAVLM